MSKPIYVTEELVQEWIREFEEKARSAKMSSGKFTYTQEVEYEDDDKAHIVFTPTAYAKMLSLLFHYDSEVAWHGIVDREGENTYVISDIMVYPQTVSGATVNTDQEKYTNWLNSIPMEIFNRMHMQGHSHVSMPVNPSAVDLNHQEAIISQLNGEHFYIFMIWNKRLDHNIKVYDYGENTLYEDKDCVVSIRGEGIDSPVFLAGSDAMVKKTTPATPAASANGYYNRDWEREYAHGGRYGSGIGYGAAAAAAEVKSAVAVKTEKGDKKKAPKPEKKSGKKAAADQKPAATQAPANAAVQTSIGRGLDNVTDFDEFMFGKK